MNIRFSAKDLEVEVNSCNMYKPDIESVYAGDLLWGTTRASRGLMVALDVGIPWAICILCLEAV